jgi:hypothetical protein
MEDQLLFPFAIVMTEEEFLETFRFLSIVQQDEECKP